VCLSLSSIFFPGLIMAGSAKKGMDRKEFVDKPKRILLSLR